VSEHAPIDVTTIVTGIRADIAQRRAAGDLSIEDVESLLEPRLRDSIAKTRIDPALATRLLIESYDWNIDSGYEIRTRHAGIGGFLIRAAKITVRPFVRLYTDYLFNRQAQLNLAMWQTMRDTVEHNAALTVELHRLKQKVKRLTEQA
jgi:hypothetical protein